MRITMRRSALLFAIMAVAGALAGCSMRPIDLPHVNRYSLVDVHTPALPARVVTAKTLLVTLPLANPGYQTSKMAFRTTPYDLRFYALNAWIAPPAEMFLPILTQHLRARGYFKVVVPSPFMGVTDWQLNTRILMLQQEFMQPVSVLHLAVEAVVVNPISHRVIGTKRFAVRVSAPGNNAYAGVVAANKAATQVSAAISRYVVSLVRASARTGTHSSASSRVGHR